MERLTYDFSFNGIHSKQVKGADNFLCKDVCELNDGCEKCPISAAFDRLAAIEDILGDNYDLERLKELVEADREGRCVVLPVKEKETFYTVVRVRTLCHLGYYFDDYDCQGCEEDFCDSKLEFEVKKNTGCSKSQVLSLIEDQKKIYLSEQDAEAALKTMKGEKEND